MDNEKTNNKKYSEEMICENMTILEMQAIETMQAENKMFSKTEKK